MTKLLSSIVFLLLLGVGSVIAIRHWNSRPLAQPTTQIAPSTDSLALALTPLSGNDATDRVIADLQGKVRAATDPNPLLERLGWALVAKARITSDPGFYKLAEAAAAAMTKRDTDDLGALLLRGHVDHAMHRFAEAEAVARSLTTKREFPFDYALLGDALMEQGNLPEAIEAYQKMVDLKPCLQTYSRVAYMRWLKGDLDGAIAATRLAISSGSANEPEPVAWAYTRLAFYELQKSNPEQASASVARALELVPQYAPALLMRGRVELATGHNAAAIADLKLAAALNPLPEYLWTLAEALQADGKDDDARATEATLRRSGVSADPRTLALYLATRGQDPDLALRLATEELGARHDVFTRDTVAWAEFAKGDKHSALANSRLALAEGTHDARLFFHSGTIAAATGDRARALELFNEARSLEMTLLPSERAALAQQISALVSANNQIATEVNPPVQQQHHDSIPTE